VKRSLVAEAAEAGLRLRRTGFDRAELSSRLVDAATQSAGPDESLSSARKLGSPGAIAVVAGQQPGFLGGPILTFLKAAHATVLARAIEQSSGIPTVPLFWNHSDDHDLDETRPVVLINGRGEARRITLELGRGRPFLSDLLVPPQAEAAWTRVVELLPPGPDRERVVELFRPQAGHRFAAETTRILFRLLGEQGLVVFEPRDLRPLLSRALARVIRSASDGQRRLAARCETLRSRGAKPPFDAKDPPLVFERTAKGRERVHFDGTRFSLPDGEVLSPAALADAIDATPERFTAGVACRSAVEALALPAAAVVKGPSELAYGPLALDFLPPDEEREAPVAVPRFSALLLEPRWNRALRSYGVTAATVLGQGTLPQDDAETTPLENAVRSIEEELSTQLESLRPKLVAFDSNLARPLQKTLETSTGALSALRRKLRSSADSRAHSGVDPLRTVLAALEPLGAPQERVMPIAPFLCGGFDATLHLLLDSIDVVPTSHVVLHLPDGG
jgi:bacillithiol synthase